jgi:hypothetical protein
MIAPKGVALRMHLMMLFVAHCDAKVGRLWVPYFPVEATPSLTSWMQLVVANAGYNGPGIQTASVAANKQRQLIAGLKKMRDLGLASFPNGPSHRGFELLHESGTSEEGSAPIMYTVPIPSESCIELPVTFFTQGWVHLLTTSEIAALLMWLHVTKFSGFDTEWGRITHVTSAGRQAGFGLSREAYETHKPLAAFGLLDIVRPEKRHYDGKWENFKEDASDLRCHRAIVRPEGFGEAAYDVVRTVVERRELVGSWERPLALRAGKPVPPFVWPPPGLSSLLDTLGNAGTES